MSGAHSSGSNREPKQSGKKSYADPVKAKSRDALEKFVRTHLSFKKPKKLEVLCFPGAEQDGEAGLELAVYDRLGIPRKNITGLECDPERAERLRSANLGIDVVCAYDSDFLRDAAKKGRSWDVISLDYCSFFTRARADVFHVISSSKLLKDTAVLCTNFMARREHVAAQQFMQQAYDGLLTVRDVIGSADPNKILSYGEIRVKMEEARVQSGVTLGGARSVSVPGFVATSIICPVSDALAQARSLPWSAEFFESLQGFIGRLEPDERASMWEMMEETGVESEQEAILSGYNGQIILNIALLCKLDDSGVSREHANLWYHDNKPACLEAYEGYKYVSNSGTPMIFDLFYWDRHRRELQKYDNILKYDSFKEKYVLAGDAKNQDEAQKIVTEAHTAINAFWDRNSKMNEMIIESERIDLGSSYVREKGKGKLSKDEAVALLEGGVPIGEILDAYSGFTDHQLRAFKAHIKMGTYEQEDGDVR